MAWRVSFFGDEIEEISEFDPLTGKKGASLDTVRVYANSHYVTPGPTMKQATRGDPLRADGAAQGTARRRPAARSPAARAADQFRPRDDRRHRLAAPGSRTTAASSPAACRASRRRRCSNTCPTTRCCSSTRATRRCRRSARWRKGDHRRKITLAEYGFRLPSCIDNRPLRFNEWDAMRPQTFAVSATPGIVGDGADRRRVRRAGDPPDRADRPAGRDPPGRGPGAGLHRRMPQDRAEGLPHARHHADQADGRGPDRVHARGRAAGALHALRRRDAGAHRADPRPAARASTTCWSASTCCARGSTFPSAGWCASSMPTRKASCAPRPR